MRKYEIGDIVNREHCPEEEEEHNLGVVLYNLNDIGYNHSVTTICQGVYEFSGNDIIVCDFYSPAAFPESNLVFDQEQ